jgi:hypothetical protein
MTDCIPKVHKDSAPLPLSSNIDKQKFTIEIFECLRLFPEKNVCTLLFVKRD